MHLGDAAAAADFARVCNGHAAELVAKHPGRFGFFAVLPMPETELAAKEAAYALDVLKADGVVLLGRAEVSSSETRRSTS